MECYILKLDNIHCHSCIDTIQGILAPLVPQPTRDFVLIDIQEKTVTVAVPQRNNLLKDNILTKLYDAGFDVLFVDQIKFEKPVHSPSVWDWMWRSHKRHKRHREHCESCQEKVKSSRRKRSDSENSETSESTLGGVKVLGPDSGTPLYRAIFSVGGMTCAACQNAITAAINDELPQVAEFGVDLMTKSAIAVVSDKRLVNSIQNIITDIGYECEVMEVIPMGRSSEDSEDIKKFRVVASIGGMTCASCVTAVREQMELLPFVLEVNIDLLGNSGDFIITEPKINVPKLQEAIEDAGYEFSPVSVTPTMTTKSKARTINLSVTGMFCRYVILFYIFITIA